MLARDLIKKCIVPEYQKEASVIALIPLKHSWWYIHKDEKLPKGKPICIRVKA